MIAPIVIAIILITYYALYFGYLISQCNLIALTIVLKGFLKYLLGIIALALTALTLYVTIERINEIRSGNEDDLSKY